MDANRAGDIARIDEALLAALTEAQGKVTAGQFDADLADLVRHAQEMHVLLTEALVAAEPDIDPRPRGMAAAMGARITLLA